MRDRVQGSYSRFMSKCKVVDMSSMSPEEQQQRMKQHAAGSPPPGAPAAPSSTQAQAPQVPAPSAPSPQSSFDGLGKGFLGGSQLYGQDGSPEGTGTQVRPDALLDELMGGIDPEFAAALKPVEDQETKEMYDTLGDIAKVLGSGPMGASMNQVRAPLSGPLAGLLLLRRRAFVLASLPSCPASRLPRALQNRRGEQHRRTLRPWPTTPQPARAVPRMPSCRRRRTSWTYRRTLERRKRAFAWT